MRTARSALAARERRPRVGERERARCGLTSLIDE
jgi:hypothetical protein